MSRFTINDIAKEAGVSKATVSRVINTPGIVGPATRERVQHVIHKYHFVPSVSARNLSTQTSTTIGVIVPEVDNPFFGEILRGITTITDQKNLFIVCFNSDDMVEKDKKALQNLKSIGIAGLLYTPATDYAYQEESEEIMGLLSELEAPVVIMDRNTDTFRDFDGVFFDDRKSVFEATKTLIEAGKKKLGIINATMEFVLARERHAGFMDALSKYGIPYDDAYVALGSYSMSSSYELSLKMLRSSDCPEAVITCNNAMSLGFLKALTECGMRLGRDISCIGLDRIEAIDIIGSEFNYIERDARKMGQKAMRLLIRRMEQPEESIKKVFFKAPVVVKKL